MSVPEVKRRRKLLIDPRFQLSFLTYTISVSFAIIALSFGTTHYFFWKLTEKGKSLGLPQEHVFFRFLEDQRWTLNLIVASTAIGVFLLLVLTGLHLSNRIAGPIYRMRKHLRDRKSTRAWTPINTREGDYFQELAHDLNESFKAGTD